MVTEEMKEQRKIQRARKRRLTKLMDLYRCWPGAKYGDYDYGQLTAVVGDPDEPTTEPLEDCPRYACQWSDETYSMLCLYDNRVEAIQSMAALEGDTLNSPGPIFDLDVLKFGKGGQPMMKPPNIVPYRLVAMSEDTAQALAGIVAMNDGTDVLDGGEATNKDGIFCDWDELRTLFPIEDFRLFAAQHDPDDDGDGYLPDAGF